jgi:hypothetical protein
VEGREGVEGGDVGSEAEGDCFCNRVIGQEDLYEVATL